MKSVVFKVEDKSKIQDVLCTTYQMRNFYTQFKDGFFTNLDVMNYIQHHKAALMPKKGDTVLDVCCGRSLLLPLLRYYNKEIKEYIGVDISKSNIMEAMRGASKKNLTIEELKSYYPFDVRWKLGNVAEMSSYIDENSVDFVVYTSAVEHMHKDAGLQSLIECYKVMKSGSKMFLSCPNTPGNGYNTQYSVHVYEWGYEELKNTVQDIGFSVVDEIGLVSNQKDIELMYQDKSEDMKQFYNKMKSYLPSAWFTAIMAIPFASQSKEILFILEKK